MKAKGEFIAMMPVSHSGNAVSAAAVMMPVDKRAKEIVAELLRRGTKTLMWAHTARHPEFHRYSWAVIGTIAEATGFSKESVYTFLKRETGRFDWVRMPDGSTERQYHSADFESMSQEDYQEFWNDALVVVREQIIPDISDEDYNRLRDMIAGKVD